MNILLTAADLCKILSIELKHEISTEDLIINLDEKKGEELPWVVSITNLPYGIIKTEKENNMKEDNANDVFKGVPTESLKLLQNLMQELKTTTTADLKNKTGEKQQTGETVNVPLTLEELYTRNDSIINTRNPVTEQTLTRKLGPGESYDPPEDVSAEEKQAARGMLTPRLR